MTSRFSKRLCVRNEPFGRMIFERSHADCRCRGSGERGAQQIASCFSSYYCLVRYLSWSRSGSYERSPPGGVTYVFLFRSYADFEQNSSFDMVAPVSTLESTAASVRSQAPGVLTPQMHWPRSACSRHRSPAYDAHGATAASARASADRPPRCTDGRAATAARSHRGREQQSGRRVAQSAASRQGITRRRYRRGPSCLGRPR